MALKQNWRSFRGGGSIVTAKEMRKRAAAHKKRKIKGGLHKKKKGTGR